MATEFDTAVEDITAHLTSERQAWLFGAGISCMSGLPLMYPLTQIVAGGYADPGSEHHNLFSELRASLPEEAHIEHVLSQLGDFIALAERSKDQRAHIGSEPYGVEVLKKLHGEIRDAIRTVIRRGYVSGGDGASPTVADEGKHVVGVHHHRAFLKTLFSVREKAGRPLRPVHFFTLNYDTLIEDALALERISFADGFSGGAMAYWSPETAYSDAGPGGRVAANLVKLHGSIDWHAELDGSVIRCREGCGYPDRAGNVLIYPQSTKYVATQRDPFAALFERFRSVLRSSLPTVLAVCGYSFGDEHVDLQIEEAMSKSDSKTILVALVQEQPTETGKVLPQRLVHWLNNMPWANRVFVLSDQGLYHGSTRNLSNGNDAFDWWTFGGMTKFLADGPQQLEDNMVPFPAHIQGDVSEAGEVTDEAI